MHVLETLAPVFLLIALGAWLRRLGLMPIPMAEWAGEITYWVALPTLLFLESAGARIHFAEHFDLLAILLGGMGVCIVAGYAAGLLLRLPSPATASLAQAAFRGNLAFIGIPVSVYSFGEKNEAGTTLAILIVAAMIPFYNIAAVVVLLAGQHRFNLQALRAVVRRLLTNPLILACAAGLLLAHIGWRLPLMVTRTLEPLGKMALPLALLSIGSALDLEKVHGFRSAVISASLIKVAGAPLAGLLLGRLVGLTSDEMHVALVLLACPTAAASYVMADLMGGETQLTAGAIVLSTLLSFGSLLIIIWT